MIITNNRGIPLACSDSIARKYNDAYELGGIFHKMMKNLQLSKFAGKGLLLNADAGFNVSDFRSYCYKNEIFENIDQNKRNGSFHQGRTIYDELLYKVRSVIERTNGWLDAIKAILARFETNDLHWKGLLLLACTVILLRKL